MVSIVGNAKNAGKTTVLNEVIKHKNERLMITSIGLDGEEIDQVTFLEKPQVYVRKNDIIATAKDCLQQCLASFSFVQETSIQTAIGPVVICEVDQPGKVLIAGPSTVDDMDRLIQELASKYRHQILIDGAFSRQSFARISETTIFVIGANASIDIHQTVEEAYYAYRKLTLPKVDIDVLMHQNKNHIVLFNEQGAIDLGFDTLLGNEVDVFKSITDHTKWLYIPKSLTDEFINRWINHYDRYRFDIIVQSSVNIQLSNQNLSHLFKMNCGVFVLHPINVSKVCVNPFSPRGYNYDGLQFKEMISERLGVKAINVKEVDKDE